MSRAPTTQPSTYGEALEKTESLLSQLSSWQARSRSEEATSRAGTVRTALADHHREFRVRVHELSSRITRTQQSRLDQTEGEATSLMREYPATTSESPEDARQRPDNGHETELFTMDEDLPTEKGKGRESGR